MGKRIFPDFVEAFESVVGDIGVPASFVRWAGIFAVSAAMGRHVHAVNRKGMTWPNLYVMMVAPPGVGKSMASELLKPIFTDMGLNYAPEQISKASLIDHLAATVHPVVTENQELLDYHYATILADEFTQTFPSYDMHVLGTLNHWWSCPDIVREQKRVLGKDPILIKNVCCQLLTGIQPSVLASQFPLEAWQGGFLARTVFVYEPEAMRVPLRTIPGVVQVQNSRGVDPEGIKRLTVDLEAIRQFNGFVDDDESFAICYGKWLYDDKMQPMPKNPRLADYCTRREHQLEKLALISTASRGARIMTGYDYERARVWLEEAERNIDEIFVEMAATDEEMLMRELNRFLWIITQGGKRAVPEMDVWKWLVGRKPTQQMATFIQAAERAGFLKTLVVGQSAASPGSALILPTVLPEMEGQI